MTKHKYLRHIFNSRAIIFYVSFFMLVSCGIPTNIYLKEGITNEEGVSYYQFSSQAEDTDSYITTLAFDLVDDSLVVEDTPSICYFYSIFPSDLSSLSESSYSSKIITQFNSIYTSLPGRRLDSNQSDSSVLNIDYNNNKIKLFKFNYNGNEQMALSYLTTIKSLNYNQEYEVKFKIQNLNNGEFNFEEFNSSLFETHDSTGNISETENIALLRYNNNPFKTSSIDDDDSDYTIISNTNSYKVIVFAAFTVEGQFSNIFWTNLHKVGSFDL